MELDDIVVTKLFDVMTIPIAKGTKRPITNRYCYGLTFCGTDGGRILYEYENRQYLSDYYHAVLLPMGRSYLMSASKTFASTTSRFVTPERWVFSMKC